MTHDTATVSDTESDTDSDTDRWVCTMRNGGRRRVVHATEDCCRAHGAVNLRPARLDETRRLPECKDCLGDETYRASTNPLRKCPKCRNRYGNLGKHLRHCGGGTDD